MDGNRGGGGQTVWEHPQVCVRREDQAGSDARPHGRQTWASDEQMVHVLVPSRAERTVRYGNAAALEQAGTSPSVAEAHNQKNIWTFGGAKFAQLASWKGTTTPDEWSA